MMKLFYKFPVFSNPIKFTEMELLDDDNVETMFSQQYGVEDPPRIEVPREFVDRRSPMRCFDIDLNIGCSDHYGGGLQIHPIVIEIDALGEDGSDNNGFSDHKGEDFSDPDLNDVQDNIDNE
ncbi:hypothetical protein GOBAR_DD28490 [Gossypium barbadense]|nr:hypothetical protein GOBAR_DD28490 [Gossypium barbadense]